MVGKHDLLMSVVVITFSFPQWIHTGAVSMLKIHLFVSAIFPQSKFSVVIFCNEHHPVCFVGVSESPEVPQKSNHCVHEGAHYCVCPNILLHFKVLAGL